MKWSIVALFVLGVVAALSAAFLVVRFADTTGPKTGEVRVAVAARELPQLHLVKKGDVEVVNRSKADLPSEGDWIEVKSSGKESQQKEVEALNLILGKSLTAGEVLTWGHSIVGPKKSDNSAVNFSAIPKGLAAYSLSLPEDASIYGVLYPGSTVDVIMSWKRGGDKSAPEGFDQARLRRRFVLAIDRVTVAAEQEKPVDSDRRGKRNVTLLVSEKQTNILHLARTCGSVSLCMVPGPPLPQDDEVETNQPSTKPEPDPPAPVSTNKDPFKNFESGTDITVIRGDGKQQKYGFKENGARR